MEKKIVIGFIILFFIADVMPIVTGITNTSTLTFTPTDDALITIEEADSNAGERDLMVIRNAGSGGIYQVDGLIKFDISPISSGATILSANLKLYYYEWDDNNPVGRDLNLYRATSDWDENTVTWNTQPTYASQTTVSSTVSGSYGWMTWNVTDDVQSYVDGTMINNGWKATDENYWGGGNIPQTYFRTKEYGSYQ